MVTFGPEFYSRKDVLIISENTATLLEKAQVSIRHFLKNDDKNIKSDEYQRLHAKPNIGIKVLHDEKVEARENSNQVLRAISMAFDHPQVREQLSQSFGTLKVLPDLKIKEEKSTCGGANPPHFPLRMIGCHDYRARSGVATAPHDLKTGAVVRQKYRR